MNTRSKTALNNIDDIYEVNIDFDESSRLWQANKKSIGNGSYKYMCCCITKTGNKCNRASIVNSEYCKIHTKK